MDDKGDHAEDAGSNLVDEQENILQEPRWEAFVWSQQGFLSQKTKQTLRKRTPKP